MQLERWQDWYDHLVLPYVFAFAITTAGVAVGFVYSLIVGGMVTTAALVVRWIGVGAGIFGGAAAVWMLLVEESSRRVLGGSFLLGILTLIEAVGGGYLVLRSDLATSLFALAAATLTALSLALLVLSLAYMVWTRHRYTTRMLVLHAALVISVPVALVLADRALPLEPDPIIGLVFVIVPFITLLHIANGLIVRMWLTHDPHPIHRPMRGL